MAKQTFVAIRTENRRGNADAIQKVLTEHGCNIKMRLGLHETGDFCSDEGLILLELADHSGEIGDLKEALVAIGGIKVNSMEI